ncbi:MAG: VanZ family protein [Candidatus Shapirobacteria bacterium]|nr:VanZ family protein [Candidatus Shapirobacteria bacterium]MDD4410646.1 VanZ family protein [Candidatus Shapirobacteria bacterium]
MKINKVVRFVPSIIWMSVIFYFSSRSTIGIGTNETDRFLILKSFHLIEYAFLAILLYFAIQKKKLVVLIAYLYAISDEVHQSFVPGRTSRFRDTLIDLIGILIGILIFNSFYFFINNKNHRNHKQS